MSVLSDAFNRSDAQRSLLSRVFSSPLVRGFYKDEAPETDLRPVGSKTEKKRLAHLINAIARNSPTGGKVLEAAAKAGYSVAFETMANSCGSCDKQTKTILLNPMMSDAKLTTTLAHESRHAQQDARGVNAHFCTYDVATELRLRRAKEADAQAVALQIALEIRAAADKFFSRRLQLTDRTKDISYRDLPERNPRSFAPKYAYFDMPYDVKKAAAVNAVLNKRSR